MSLENALNGAAYAPGEGVGFAKIRISLHLRGGLGSPAINVRLARKISQKLFGI